MVHPLIHDVQRMLRRKQVGDGIFRKYRDIVGIDQFRDSMVYLRINVVGASGKDDAPVTGFFQVCKRLFSLSADIVPARGKFFPCGMYGREDLGRWNGVFLGQFLHQTVGNSLFTF